METLPTPTDGGGHRYTGTPTTHDHGTRACYVAGCRRDECRAANTAYAREHRRKTTPCRVDPTVAREHIAHLVAAGMSLRAITAASGLAWSTVQGIAAGHAEVIDEHTERALLGVQTVEPGEHLATWDADVLATFEELARKYGMFNRRWIERGACRRPDVDAELFVAATTNNVPQALAVCAACVVRCQCLEYALAAGESTGVWGGTTPAQRRRLVEHQEGAA